MPIFIRDGVRLAYEVRGTGDPVVLLHGFTSLGSTWERNGLVQLLVDHDLQIVTPDARSHGSSDAVFTPAMCTTTVLADDVRALLDHLAMDAAAIVGFSMGGAVALRVALDTPARVTRLVIAGVGDAAINALHNPEEVRALADAFSGERKPENGSNAARILRNAEGAGNNPAALLPLVQQMARRTSRRFTTDGPRAPHRCRGRRIHGSVRVSACLASSKLDHARAGARPPRCPVRRGGEARSRSIPHLIGLNTLSSPTISRQRTRSRSRCPAAESPRCGRLSRLPERHGPLRMERVRHCRS